VFALNGIAVGLLQVFLIKNLFARLGTSGKREGE